MAMVRLENPPDSFAKAFVSSPFVLGHESCGRIIELGGPIEGFQVGDRVNVEPALSCAIRGIDPPCPMCRQGLLASCHNLAEGQLPPGMSIGFNAFTGGWWSEALVAHRAQLFKVPDALTDEQAVLVDPLACCLHAVLRRRPRDDETVLVVGAGIVGVGLISAIRAVGSRARILVLARHGFQRDLCLARGAEVVILPADYQDVGMYPYLGKVFGSRVHKGAFGKPILLGGADVVYDALGSRNATEDSLRLVRSGGTVMIVGMGHARWVDWDPVTHKQLTILGANGRAYEPSDPARRHTYELVHEMMLDGRLPTDGLLTHTFPLSDYKQAFWTATHKGRTSCVKAAFRI
jgi:threonine dehydrogenase-like Zn-dependent dehydrogenase